MKRLPAGTKSSHVPASGYYKIPSGETLFVQNPEGQSVNLYLSDLNGRRLDHYRGKEPTISMSPNNWSAGIYLLTGYDESGKRYFSEKIVKL